MGDHSVLRKEIEGLGNPMGQSLVRLVNSFSPGHGKEAEECLSALCREAGLAPGGRAGRPRAWLGTVPGRGGARGRLWVVSAPGEGFFPRGRAEAAVYSGGRARGAGTDGAGRGLVEAVHALGALRRLGIRPERETRLLVLPGAETAGFAALEDLFRQGAFRRGDLFFSPRGAAPDGSAIAVAGKALFVVRVEARGRGGHAAMPLPGPGALEASSLMISRVPDLRYLFSAEDEFFMPPVSTFTPTARRTAGGETWEAPAKDLFHVDSRLLPACPLEGVREAFRRLKEGVEKECRVRILLRSVARLPSFSADPSAPSVGLLAALVREETGVAPVPRGLGWSGPLASAGRRGYPVLAWSRPSGAPGRPGENAAVGRMVLNALVMARFFRECP